MRLRLAALSLAMLLPSLGTSISNVALPTMAKDFAAAPAQVQWVVIAYLLTLTAAIVGAGRIGDLWGRRRVLLLGVALFMAASAVAAFTTGLWALVGLRAVQGLAAAAITALSMGLVADLVPKEATGRAMGLLGTVSAVGTALGPSLGGVLIAGFGWPAVYVALALAGGVTLALGLTVLPADAAPRHVRFDRAGTLVLAGTLAAYAWAMTVNLQAFWLALVGFGTFVWIEGRAKAPLLDLKAMTEPVLARGLLALSLISAVVMATLVVGPFYLSRVLGLSPLGMGLAMSVGPGVAALTGRPAGGLIDRHGAGLVGRIGVIAVILGSAAMAVLPGLFGLPGYLGSLMVITGGYALFQTANTTQVMRTAPPERRGLTSALLGLARNLGLITGASGMAALFNQAPGETGLTMTFALSSLLAASALALVWPIRDAQMLRTRGET
jgi:MFS family permease